MPRTGPDAPARRGGKRRPWWRGLPARRPGERGRSPGRCPPRPPGSRRRGGRGGQARRHRRSGITRASLGVAGTSFVGVEAWARRASAILAHISSRGVSGGALYSRAALRIRSSSSSSVIRSGLPRNRQVPAAAWLAPGRAEPSRSPAATPSARPISSWVNPSTSCITNTARYPSGRSSIACASLVLRSGSASRGVNPDRLTRRPARPPAPETA